MNAQVATLIKEANSPDIAISAPAELALALNEYTPVEVLVELERVADWYDLEDLMKALRKNKKLQAAALASMEVQFA